MVSSLFLGLILFSMLDVILTWYTIFLLKKKDNFFPRMEINPIARFIIKDGSSSLRFSFMLSLFPLGMGIILYFVWNNPIQVGVVLGLLILINIIHWGNIGHISTNWDNEDYWVLRRKTFEVMK